MSSSRSSSSAIIVIDNNNNNDDRIQKRNLRFFYNHPHSAINCLQHKCSSGQGVVVCQITCNTSSAYYVQHVMLCATWYEGTAQLLSLAELKSLLF